jgi:hypothetical protein
VLEKSAPLASARVKMIHAKLQRGDQAAGAFSFPNGSPFASG